jgi:hypothetical protein
MEGIICIAGALVFGVAYAFLKPVVDGTRLVAIAIAYFGSLRLIGRFSAKQALRKSINDPGSR